MTAENSDPVVYLSHSLTCVERLLGLQNRNPSSSTYGCFDRNFWHYKIIDFSNGRLQEAALTLALLYRINHPLNPYYNKEKINRWALAAMDFLEFIQNDDGSFDEYYPHEHAFVTTAFVTFACSEALLLLETEPPGVIECLRKAAHFLIRREEREVVNQNLGAAAALYNVYLLTGDESFLRGAQGKLDTSIECQSEEGWFYEYGGPDMGYLSVAIYYLANYYLKSTDQKARSSLQKAVFFLSHFIHPDGSLGGEYGSRNTTYVIPHGIEVCAQFDTFASMLSSRIRHAFASGITLIPSHLDDRYLCTMLYTYLQAFLDSRDSRTLPEKTEIRSNFFRESGLLVEKNPSYTFIANLKKGGVFKVFSEDHILVSDSGFIGTLSNGKGVTSQWLSSHYTLSQNIYTVTGNCAVIPEERMTPLRCVLMRTAMAAGGKYASTWVKQCLRNRLITTPRGLPIRFQRTITLGEEIYVQDILQGEATFDSLYIADHAYLLYIPSSRYFQWNELSTSQYLTENLAERFNKEKKIVIDRRIISDGDR
ncbi:MAG: hypothetical protein HXS53_04505 [Theionarchaea archaeon]|nr:hypothetical protein [Theionarchaea archaeon]